MAANVAPGVTPPFLSDMRKIPRFRRKIIRYDNKTAKFIHIHDNMYKNLQILPTTEIQPMATPIKDTPPLTGKDARNFDKWLKGNEGKRISREEYQRIQDAAKKFSFEAQPGVACGGCVEP